MTIAVVSMTIRSTVVGRTNGQVIRRVRATALAPSTAAASSSSRGTAWSAAR